MVGSGPLEPAPPIPLSAAPPALPGSHEMVSFFLFDDDLLCEAPSGKMTWCGLLRAECSVDAHRRKRTSRRPYGVYLRKEGTKTGKVALFLAPHIPLDVARGSDIYLGHQDDTFPKAAGMALCQEILTGEAASNLAAADSDLDHVGTPVRANPSASSAIVDNILQRNGRPTTLSKPLFFGCFFRSA